MTICKFYQQGNCRNGARCRFEHPGANPFGALSNNTGRSQDGAETYKVTKDSIRVDLAEERPTWILSCYGPGKEAPEQLFGGYPREQSLEEVMLHIRRSANPQQALAEVTALHNQAEQQIRTTLNNLDGAVQFVLAGANKHPNRIDICKQNTIAGGTTGVFAVKTGFADNPLTSNVTANQNPFSTTQNNPFGGGRGGGIGGATPAFGQPSTLGQKPNPFGAAPASQFGQPSQLGAAAPAFGQPSQLGTSAPAFGQPSQLGASGPAFGQPSTLGQRPNPFAAAAAAPSPFSQAGQSSFGQPSALGQPANPFGAPAPAPALANPFSQTTSAPSGASPFAQVSQPAASTASPFGGQAAAPNPFAQPAASKELSMDTSGPEPALSNPFGPPPSTNTPFGTQQPAPASAFGNPSGGFANAASGPGLAAPQSQGFATQTQTPSSSTSRPGPYAPGSAKQHPPAESYITRAMNGRIQTFNGQPVVYKWKVNDRYQDQPPENPTPDQQTPGVRRPDGSWRKILFPDGPPAYNRDTEPDPAQYDAAVKAAYAQMAAAGRFQGDMPEVPPMREDCVWTF